jgi:integrase
VTFDELAEDFLRDYRINDKKTCARAGQCVSNLKKAFEGRMVIDIDTPAIRRYIEDRMKWVCKKCGEKFDTGGDCPFCKSKKVKPGAKNATINRELAALKRMLNLGAKQTPAKISHVPYIPMLKEGNTRKGFFEHGEFQALRDALPDYLKGFVTFAYKVGWRKDEISSLTWSQVDRNNWIVYLNPGETKNSEARTVYLDEELKEVFRRQWKARRKSKTLTPYVFPTWDGKRKIGDIRKVWNKACKAAKIRRRLFHDFRRTAVRNMIRAGIPERVAMMISGHNTRSVFDRYNIVSDTDLKEASAKQEIYLQSQTTTVLTTIGHFSKKEGSSPNA